MVFVTIGRRRHTVV